jgi:nitroreductase
MIGELREMKFFDVLNARRSIRKYKPDTISEELLWRIFKSTNRAPSAGNLQAFEIYVVRDEVQRSRLSRAALDQDFIREAPVVLIFCEIQTKRDKSVFDSGCNDRLHLCNANCNSFRPRKRLGGGI